MRASLVHFFTVSLFWPFSFGRGETGEDRVFSLSAPTWFSSCGTAAPGLALEAGNSSPVRGSGSDRERKTSAFYVGWVSKSERQEKTGLFSPEAHELEGNSWRNPSSSFSPVESKNDR